jgi:hypothetical protein
LKVTDEELNVEPGTGLVIVAGAVVPVPVTVREAPAPPVKLTFWL